MKYFRVNLRGCAPGIGQDWLTSAESSRLAGPAVVYSSPQCRLMNTNYKIGNTFRPPCVLESGPDAKRFNPRSNCLRPFHGVAAECARSILNRRPKTADGCLTAVGAVL